MCEAVRELSFPSFVLLCARENFQGRVLSSAGSACLLLFWKQQNKTRVEKSFPEALIAYIIL